MGQANYSSPYLHHVKLANLTPNTTCAPTPAAVLGTTQSMLCTATAAPGTCAHQHLSHCLSCTAAQYACQIVSEDRLMRAAATSTQWVMARQQARRA